MRKRINRSSYVGNATNYKQVRNSRIMACREGHEEFERTHTALVAKATKRDTSRDKFPYRVGRSTLMLYAEEIMWYQKTFE